MRPTEVQGLWMQHKNKDNKWYAGWLNRFSPRGTVAWYKTGESIGIYSVGVNVDGTKSGYKKTERGIKILACGLGLTPACTKN